MPSAYSRKADARASGRCARNRRPDGGAREPAAGAERRRKLSGPERAAVLMLALGEQYGAKIFGLLDDDELREISIVMSSLGTIEAELGRESAAGIRRPHVGLRRAARQLRRHRAPAAAIPAARAGRRHHGRNPRSRRPQHVGEARQRPGRGAGELPEERIPADRRRGAVEAAARACRARARDPAGGPLARRGQPHAARWRRCRRK